MLKLVIAGIGMSWILAAEGPVQPVQVTKTERVDFPSGGTIQLKNSTGTLTVEGWDQPTVEITTIKSTKAAYSIQRRDKAAHDLDNVRVTTERHGDEVDIVTAYPRHRAILFPHPFARITDFELEYLIKVPRSARLIAHHDQGDVNVEALTGDIEATVVKGQITLHLPEDSQYLTDAKVDVGNVNSDFPGQEQRRSWFIGHQLVNGESSGTHKLKLHVEYGDIVILKIRVPKSPEPFRPVLNPKGS